MRLNPFVHYYCPCPDIYYESEATSESAGSVPLAPIADATHTLDISSPRTEFSLHSLSRLYFCEDCHQIRCPACVQDEIISYYCPNCLFEVRLLSCRTTNRYIPGYVVLYERGFFFIMLFCPPTRYPKRPSRARKVGKPSVSTHPVPTKQLNH
ncbi:hypothetical protein BC937DRAFT_95380 [Endogone sp. FLAS-F59071]|nr:hypothetical protein BC937DRAFT_95380 [Endogone sp. FLAS-F59071]|eukprot:RUS13406.1 hypothetical protein BC937DRAFT_95380 [Endogone sp. FLAS-F59071]